MSALQVMKLLDQHGEVMHKLTFPIGGGCVLSIGEFPADRRPAKIELMPATNEDMSEYYERQTTRLITPL